MVGNNFALWILLVVCCVYHSSAKNSDCSTALGLQNGDISNDKLTASSQQTGKESYHGRLGDSSAWCASVQDTSQYLQISLGKEYYVSGIKTQGLSPNKWITKYSISTSQDGTTWTKYAFNGNVMELDGNSDAVTVKENQLSSKIQASYVKFQPLKFNNAICAKMEILGCEIEQEDKAIQIFMIVASVVAGILLICAIVFVIINIRKKRAANRRKKESSFPELDHDIFTAHIGRKPRRLSSYVADDVVGFSRKVSGVKGLNWKVSSRTQSAKKKKRSRAKMESELRQAENTRGNKTSSAIGVPFDSSMKDTSLEGGNVFLKTNPMFNA